MCAKKDVINIKNLHIVTWQGIKTGSDNPRISKIKEKNVYLDPLKEKQTYKEATNVFKEIARQEEANDNRHNTIKELIQLVQKDNSVSQFINLIYEIKHNNIKKQTKNIWSLNKKDKSDADPLVDLEIEGYHVQQILLDFGSQVNSMTHDTWNNWVYLDYTSQEYTWN